jgi:restriction endonuclease S subunit
MSISEIINSKINKSDWIQYKFSNFADNIVEKIAPRESGLKHYIGLEHLDSGSIKINRFGDPQSLKGDKLKIYKGNIIFAKRNAYLKRASLAEFDAVASAHSMVLRAKSDIVLPEFFPFFMQSDSFWDVAIRISVGGLSPTINWKQMAKQEYLLPPKDQQAKIADLLWAMDDVVEKSEKLNEKIEKSLESLIESEIHGCELDNKTINQVLKEIENEIGLKPINKLGELLKGKGIQKKDLAENGKPCVRYGELYTKHHRIIKKYYSFIPENKIDGKFLLKKNDVLFAGSGETIEEIGKSAAFISDAEVYAGSDIIIFRPNNMNGSFLGYLMNSLVVRKQLNKYGTGATVMHVYKDDINKIMVPNIDKQKQDEIAINLEKYTNNIELNSDKIQQSKQLQKSLINEIFSS